MGRANRESPLSALPETTRAAAVQLLLDFNAVHDKLVKVTSERDRMRELRDHAMASAKVMSDRAARVCRVLRERANADSAEKTALKAKVAELERHNALLANLEAAIATVYRATNGANPVDRKRRPDDDGGAPPARRMHARK